MTSSPKEFLSQFGWDEFFQSQLEAFSNKKLFSARIIGEERGLYRLQCDADTVLWSSISGKMQFNANSRKDYPVIGDWVMAERPKDSLRAVIYSVLARKSALQRKQSNDVQILSANVDYVLITTSLNGDLNYGRLDRYVVFAWESGATPVILLTKTDLYEGDLEALISEVEARFYRVKVHAVSMKNFEEAKCLPFYLREGVTAVLVGSSGVGKSTLTNFLTNEETARTQEIREDDDRGRHTTTSRALYQSVYGGLIIDTPGMRSLQFTSDEESFQKQFGEIEELKNQCRFNNCRHETEPDCAIRVALETGALEGALWKSYCKLLAEARFSERRQNKVLYAEDRKLWKKQSILARQNFKPNR